ncbi:MAG: dolichyl-phosphate beta-glucosyltransferase [Elusimicrobiota bacterium]|nr:dolichyl-phosphate beta-glucosyltransferase [Elusimicrobiota bacterium]
MEKNIELSVVIPCRNEEKNITRALKLTGKYLLEKNIPGEIIVVDDGSDDATSEIAEKKAESISNPVKVIKLGKNFGKGAAVRKGVLASSGNPVLFTDADFSTDISELENFLPVIKSGAADIVIASRSLPESVLVPPQSFVRRAIGTLCRFLVSVLSVKGYKDTQCGFKLFSRKAALAIFSRLKTDGFAFDVETLVLAEKLGFSVKEMPVRWKNSSDSRVRPVKDSFSFFLQLLRGF